MQHVRIALALLALSAALCAQTDQRPLPPSLSSNSQQQRQQPAAPSPASNAPADLASVLAQIQDAAQSTNVDLSQLRIEKWKTDSDVKQQARSNTESLQRNLSAALPSLVTQVRTNPNDLTTLFRLYRNIGALYDVLANVAEATGAFGAKQEYQALGAHVDQFDSARLKLGDIIEAAAQRQSAELAALRNARTTAQQASSSTAPKKIIVDNAPTTPAKKRTTHKTTAHKASTTAKQPAADTTNAPK